MIFVSLSTFIYNTKGLRLAPGKSLVSTLDRGFESLLGNPSQSTRDI